MNERIKELVHEASDFMSETANWSHLTGSHNDIFHAKFAELIVRECMEWCDVHATIDGTAQKIRDDIKKYFGVE